jgi:hypothetical protein
MKIVIYNSCYTIYPFKVYSSVALTYSQNYNRFQNILSYHKETPIVISSQTLFPANCHTFHSPWQPAMCFLSEWIFLFWTFHRNGIIYFVAFYKWLPLLSIVFPRLIHAVTCVSTSLLFTARYSTIWHAYFPCPSSFFCQCFVFSYSLPVTFLFISQCPDQRLLLNSHGPLFKC